MQGHPEEKYWAPGARTPQDACRQPESKMSTDTRMVAILHTDLPLSSGKLPDQAGHAFLTAWRKAHEQDPAGTKNYAESG